MLLYIGNKLSEHGFTKTNIETLGPQLESEGYTVNYAGTKRNPLPRLAEMLWSIFTYRHSVNVVLIDTYSSKAYWYAWSCALFCRVLQLEYIPVLHGGDLPLRLKKSPLACKAIFNHSHANVAVSGYLEHAFQQAGYPAVVIPNNIDISEYPFKKRQSLKPRLLWVRSFHRIYNPNMAADVLRVVLKKYPHAQLCMVGPDKDGSMEEFKKYAAKTGVSGNIKITGRLSKTEWHQLSGDYDIFINTTNIDNTPVSVIEAMALGLPVVSTNVGGIPFLLEHEKDALLVEVGNATEMAEQIVRLLENPELASCISINARNKAENFDWKVVREQWIALLC